MIPLLGVDFSLPLKNPVLLFAMILFIILFAPLILNKLRIPHLIGLIIAGAVIGPNGFNLMERDMSIILFGTVGLLYIMFLAGLEIDLADFKKNSKKSLVFGLLTFLIPMGIGIAAGVYVLEFSIPTSVLLASMFASHTLIAYPILGKFGVAKNRAVTITIGGTMITDTLALLVLAVIAGMQTGEINQEFWIRLGVSVVVFALVVMILFPIIGRWFFKRFDDNISQYIFVLGMVFLGSFLAELAGIEAIIGAFLAGLAMNRLIPHTSPLMNRIEFVGNALFIPFFLIGVGMLINYEAFIKDTETLIVAGVMTFVALFSKYLAAFFTQKIFKYTIDERRLIFGLSSAQAAATLAAVLVGYNIITSYDSLSSLSESGIRNNKIRTENNQEIHFEGIANNQPLLIGAEAKVNGFPAKGAYILPSKVNLVFQEGKLADIKMPNRLLNESVLNGTILMILITCTIASFVAQKGAYNLALKEEDESDETDDEDESPERILIPLKKLELAEELVNLSVTLKSKKNTHGIFGLHVINTDLAKSNAETKSRKILDQAVQMAAATDTILQPLMRYDLNVLNAITSTVKEKKITDVIVGLTDELNPGESVYGNLTENILAKCETTTIIYRSVQPIATVKRYIVVIPERAEREIGFPFWLIKMWNLGKNTGSKLVIYAATTTLNLLKEIHAKHPVDVVFNEFNDWDDFLILSRGIQKDDSLVVVMSRKGHLSHHQVMQNIPVYITKYFLQNNTLMIFPIQSGVGVASGMDLKNPAALETFTENLERLEDVRKLIGKLFKRK